MCDCIDKVELRFETLEVKQASLRDTYEYNNGNGRKNTYSKVKVSYLNGDVKTESVKHTYCPFCGVKY